MTTSSKQIFLILVLAQFCSTNCATVATNPAPQLNFGVVSMKKIMGSGISKDHEAVVQQLQQELEAPLKAMDADLTKQIKALESKSKVADLETLEKEQEKFNEARAKRDLAAKSAEEKLKRAITKEMEKLTKLVHDGAKKLLKTLNLDLILADETGAVLAYSDRVDITDSLVAEVKKMQSPKAETPKASEAAKTTASAAKSNDNTTVKTA